MYQYNFPLVNFFSLSVWCMLLTHIVFYDVLLNKSIDALNNYENTHFVLWVICEDEENGVN